MNSGHSFKTGGRRHHFSAAQWWRLHLLALITPVHSFNLLVRRLPEQIAWRRFARLRRLAQLPDVRMMNAFREEVGVSGLRQINSHLLDPLIENCVRRWAWRPDYVVADMGYLGAEAKRFCRQRWRVTVLTHVRAKMKMVTSFESETQVVCPQGQPLHWLGYDGRLNQHEFGPAEPASLCALCWEQNQCSRRFDYPPSDHETLLGLLPLCTRAAQHMLQKMRPWVETTQAYEKNQLGLSQVFLNSLRLTWTMCLLADAVSIMRARALWERPPVDFPLKELLPQQMVWDWM